MIQVAAILIISLGLFYLLSPQLERSTHVAFVKNVEGDVFISQNDKVHHLTLGQKVNVKDQIQTAYQGRLQLEFLDQTLITLQENSQLKIQQLDQHKHFHLSHGTLKADVTPQEQPFKVFTSDAEITVLGTIFEVIKELDQTQLNVLEGKVQIQKKWPSQTSARSRS